MTEIKRRAQASGSRSRSKNQVLGLSESRTHDQIMSRTRDVSSSGLEPTSISTTRQQEETKTNIGRSGNGTGNASTPVRNTFQLAKDNLSRVIRDLD